MAALQFLLMTAVCIVSALQDGSACAMPGFQIISNCQQQYQFKLPAVLKIFGGLRTSAAVEAYCSNDEGIIACLDPITKDCKAGESALDLKGYDKDSASKAFKGYCNDKSTYISGIPCYDSNDAALTTCENTYQSALASATAAIIDITSNSFKTFYEQLCPAQVTGVKCVLNALSNCSADVKTVIKNTGYAMLHSRCKTSQYTSYTSDYDSGSARNGSTLQDGSACAAPGFQIISCQHQHQFKLAAVLKIFGGLQTSEDVEAYCSNYEGIIACLGPITKDCKAGESALDFTGYDKDSASKAFKGYCNDKSTYISGIPCYISNNAALRTCENTYQSALSSAAAAITDISSNSFKKYYEQLCPAQVAGVKCVLNALSSCASDVKTVIKNTGYAMLHSRCKTSQYTSNTSDYDSGSARLSPTVFVLLLPATLVTLVIRG